MKHMASDLAHVANRYSTTTASLGAVVLCKDICSSIGPFKTLPGFKTVYPPVVVEALACLYREYNEAFRPLVERNREHFTDYRYCFIDGAPINFGVQIDMVALPQGLLDELAMRPVEEVVAFLRFNIFEIENSLAMYQLLERIFSNGAGTSYFKNQFRLVLNGLRSRIGKPIALLAVTDQKYKAMLESEFGWTEGEPIPSSQSICDLSGFDAFFGPTEFLQHLQDNGGECSYALYVRSSDPIAKLKDPNAHVEHPLLSDPVIRRVIKANAITFNVDTPGSSTGLINDTKLYMPPMGMAFLIHKGEEEMYSPGFLKHIQAGKPYATFTGTKLSSTLTEYLVTSGVRPQDVDFGNASLRAKPAGGTYGCYGHVVLNLTDRGSMSEFRRNTRRRGAYIIQPEIKTPAITNLDDGVTSLYIDRNFMGVMPNGDIQFLGGFRSLMPITTVEAKNARVHGNGSTLWAEITA